MNAKTAIERIIGKGGLKPGSSRADSGLEKGQQAGAAPRKPTDEVAPGKGKMPEPEDSGLLQVSRARPEPARPPRPTDTALGLGSKSPTFPLETTGLVVLDSLDKLSVSHFHSQIFFNDS